jgi:hypothetical protein
MKKNFFLFKILIIFTLYYIYLFMIYNLFKYSFKNINLYHEFVDEFELKKINYSKFSNMIILLFFDLKDFSNIILKIEFFIFNG